VGGEAPVTPVSSLDSSSLNLSYKPCDNRRFTTLEIMELESKYAQLESKLLGNKVASKVNP
jgi:hypothetical protein